MADVPFLSEIRLFPYPSIPTGWALCNGQLLSIEDNQMLYSLIGNIYGGDNVSTFALPDLRGRIAMEAGEGQGLTPRMLGQSGGQETVTLNESQMPAHTHPLGAQVALADSRIPEGAVLARTFGGYVYNHQAPLTPMNEQAISSVGGGEAHINMQPYLTLAYCLATEGLYPSFGSEEDDSGEDGADCD